MGHLSGCMGTNGNSRWLHGDGAPARSRHADRWCGIERPYTGEDVERLRGSVHVEHTLARRGAERLWELLHAGRVVRSLGAMTGNQAVQQVKAGLEAIYLSGWQVAADANLAGQMYPDQSLYPANSVPAGRAAINQALPRADQIHHAEGHHDTDWFAPIVADAEAGFGGALNVFELMKAMIEAGAAGVHFEDQLASEKKCGHMGGKVLLPTAQAIRNLIAARLAADVLGVPTILLARTDAEAADTDHERRRPRATPSSSPASAPRRASTRRHAGLDQAIARGLAYAPYADLDLVRDVRPRTSTTRERSPTRSTSASPASCWPTTAHPRSTGRASSPRTRSRAFQDELATMGYRFQFVTLAGFHALYHSMFELAHGYRERGMAAYSELQQREFGSEDRGYTATAPPARGRRRLLRRGRAGDRGRDGLHHRPDRVDGGGAVHDGRVI